METPDSIVRVDTEVLVGISSYDAYVYEYLNVENGKKYVGSHLGEFGDGYWHSSTNIEFIDLFSGMSPMFEYKILAVGSYEDMQNLESKIHKDNNVVKNPMYYNLGVAPSAFKVPVRQNMMNDFVLQKIHAGDFNVSEPWNKSTLLERGGDSLISALQVRYEDNPKITEIRNLIRQKGDASKCGRILMVELGGGKYLIINGNSTLLAVEPLDFVTKLRVAIIPKSFIDQHDINESELRYIGQLMNPEQEIVTTPTSEDDLIKTLQQFYVDSDKKIKFNCDYNLNYIYSILKCSPQKAGAIARKAKKQYHEDVKLKSGSKVIDYRSDSNPTNHQKVLDRVEKLKKQKEGAVVIHGGTGAPKTLAIEALDAFVENPKAHEFIILIHHDTDENYRKWETKNRSVFKNRISGMMRLSQPIDGVLDENGIKRDGVVRTFRILEMDHEESDIS